VKRPNQLSLVVVRDDGSRVLRLRLPRRLPVVVVVAALLTVLGVGLVAGDWWHLRTRRDGIGAVMEEVEAQRATIAGFNRRIAKLRGEIAGWHELHARIGEPFGPDAAPRRPQAGIGGAHAVAPEQPAERAAASDELSRLGEAVLEEGESLRALERMISRAGKALTSLPSCWPVRGPVNSEFGVRASPWTRGGEFHSSIDIGAERGTRVVAPAAGTVAFAGTHVEYGLTVILDHGENLRTVYGHLSRLDVSQGRTVARGTEVGLTSNSGRSSGPHLHYEILVDGRPVNPRAYFWD
jgi:murein DD-endopeptidase MepM/ murein hydrolase activator NlpD